MMSEPHMIPQNEDRVKHYNADEEFRMLAEAREEQLRSEKSAMSFWKKEGREEGRAEERVIAVTNLINKGVDKDFITSLGYTEAEYSAAYEKLYPQIK